MPKFKQDVSRKLQVRAAAEAAETRTNAGGFELPDPDTEHSDSDSCHESGESDGGCDGGSSCDEDNDCKGAATKALHAEGVTAAAAGATTSRRRRKTAEPEAGAGPGKNPTHDDDVTTSVHPGQATLHRVPMPAPVPRRGSRKTTSLHAVSREVFGVGGQLSLWAHAAGASTWARRRAQAMQTSLPTSGVVLRCGLPV